MTCCKKKDLNDLTFEQWFGELRDRVNEMKKKKPEKHNLHYQAMSLQPIEVMKQWMTREQYTGFCLGNSLKYLGRFNLSASGKGGMNDLLKAKQYLDWLIEVESEE